MDPRDRDDRGGRSRGKDSDWAIQGSIRFKEGLRKKAKARFGFDRVGRNDRTERSLELYIYIYIYIVGGGIQVEDPHGDRFDSERGIQVDGTDSTGSDSYIYIGGSESRGKKIDVDRI